VSEMCYIFFSDKVFYEPVMTIRVFNDLDTACRSMGKGGGGGGFIGHAHEASSLRP
jgi:hypothetical protein